MSWSRLVRSAPSCWSSRPLFHAPRTTLLLLKDYSLTWFRYFSRQIDYVTSQKCRRALSWLGFYSRIWDRDRLRSIMETTGRKFFHRHRKFLVGLSIVSPTIGHGKASYDWNSKRLPDDFMLNHKNDIHYAQFLTQKTLTCSHCNKRHVIERPEPRVHYCNCSNKKHPVYGVQVDDIPWTPFLEKKDIIVWRKPNPDSPGLFIYMMYGVFDDVSANEFLEVQLDLTEFRLTWDLNSAQCTVLEEEYQPFQNSLSQIYFWEVNWPRFFSNRDYVCNRRTQIFGDDNIGVVYSKAATHPSAPKKTKNFRVEDYWSILCVRPTESWDQNGVEFSLIAFENPGLSLPASITTWVAMRGMPEFMENLRSACKKLRGSRNNTKVDLLTDKAVDAGILPKTVKSSTSCKYGHKGCPPSTVNPLNFMPPGSNYK